MATIPIARELRNNDSDFAFRVVLFDKMEYSANFYVSIRILMFSPVFLLAFFSIFSVPYNICVYFVKMIY